MIIRAALFLFCFAPLTLATGAAFAQQDQPYAPHQHSRSELIDFGTYDEPPLVFDFELLDVEQQAEAKHVNFVMTANADYATVVQFFKDAHHEQATAARIAPGLMPLQRTRELKVVGYANMEGVSATTRFTLSASGLTRQFDVDVSADGQNAVLTMKNVVMSRLFSGVVPARAGFKPAGAATLGLLYN